MKSLREVLLPGSRWQTNFRQPGADWSCTGSVIVTKQSTHVIYMVQGPDSRQPLNPTRLLGQPADWSIIGNGVAVYRRTPHGDSMLVAWPTDSQAPECEKPETLPQVGNYSGYLTWLQASTDIRGLQLAS